MLRILRHFNLQVVSCKSIKSSNLFVNNNFSRSTISVYWTQMNDTLPSDQFHVSHTRIHILVPDFQFHVPHSRFQFHVLNSELQDTYFRFHIPSSRFQDIQVPMDQILSFRFQHQVSSQKLFDGFCIHF